MFKGKIIAQKHVAISYFFKDPFVYRASLEAIGFKSVARIEELLPEMDALVLRDAPAFNLPLL